MEIGYETDKGLTLDPEISDVLFENITVLYNFHKPVISIHNSDDAYVHDIVYRSILVENAFMQGDNGNNKELIEMTLQNSAWSTAKDEFGSIDDVLIDGLTVLNTTNGKVPASRLAEQTYKGAIFWDTEMFMLDFYLACMPEVAKHCLEYRIETLPGALEKAKSYGYAGSFYAWESVEGGKDACTDYNVTDVFTGRPMRTFFRDTQIHISAAVVYGLQKYTAYTGDDSLLRSGGAQVVLECARFYMSLMSKRILSSTYDLLNVMGPDEYHEHVNNNAYTNEMARMTLRYAVEVCRLYLPDTTVQELDAFLDAAEHLKRQAPNPKTGAIEQFDGYFKLEDVPVPQVRSRLLDPREY